MNGFTFYRGPSMLDGSQIRLVGTCLATASQNQKTGDCSQFFILPDLVSPAKGKDRAGVCGDCPIINACYLRWGWIARQVWETDYPDYKPAEHWQSLRHKKHRYGAAGDPAGIPARIWSRIRKHAIRGWLSYTQFWQQPKFQHLKTWSMASCHTLEQRDTAEKLGWSVYLATDETVPGIKLCPYEKTEGMMRCAYCGLCDGRNGSIQITQHGGAGAMNAWKTINKEAHVEIVRRKITRRQEAQQND